MKAVYLDICFNYKKSAKSSFVQKLVLKNELHSGVLTVKRCVFSQALSKALLELRAEMTSAAEHQVVASAAQKEESLNVQLLVDRHTKDLRVRAQC